MPLETKRVHKAAPKECEQLRGAAGRGLVCAQQPALCLLLWCEKSNLRGLWIFSASPGTVLYAPCWAKGGQELLRYKVMLLCNPLAGLCFECHLWLTSKL